MFVGFSSAPFYAQLDECSRFDPDEDCASLRSATTRLYFAELAVGVYMLCQTALAVTLYDNIRMFKLAAVTRKLAQISLIFYPSFAVLRCLCYINMHSILAVVDKNHEDKGLGSFLAEYVEDTISSIIVASCILVMLFLYFLSNIWLSRTLGKLLDFMRAQKQVLIHNQSIL